MTAASKLVHALTTHLAVGDDDLAALSARFADQAASRDLVDVGYRLLDTPVGRLLLAATAQGIVRVAYADDGGDAALDDLAGTVSVRVVHAPSRLDDAARQLDQYFAGTRRAFDLPLDLQRATPFKLQVLEFLRTRLPYGTTASYGTVAAGIHHPGASRAVGTACRTNPLPVIVPCHRVVLAGGAAGDYVGGRAAKHTLLTLEAAA